MKRAAMDPGGRLGRQVAGWRSSHTLTHHFSLGIIRDSRNFSSVSRYSFMFDSRVRLSGQNWRMRQPGAMRQGVNVTAAGQMGVAR